MSDKYISTIQAAKILGISRVAVLKQIKTGRLRAVRIGRNYAIDRRDLGDVHKPMTSLDKSRVTRATKKLVKDYGATLKKLGRE